MRRLLVSVHDAAPGNREALCSIHGILRDAGIGSRYCLLLVPDLWNEQPLADHPDFVRWIRELAGQGVEIALHGYAHLAAGRQETLGKRITAAVMTNGEDEFLGLPREEASRRLTMGLAVIREVLGPEAAPGFVAPAWLYSRGTLEVLSDLRIPWTEDHRMIRFPDGRAAAIHSPVVCFATRSGGRRMLSVLWSLVSPVVLGFHSTVRIAIHPSDLSCPVLVRRLPGLLRRHSAEREVCLYRDLRNG